MKVLHLYTNLNKVCGISRVIKCIFENHKKEIETFGLFEGGESFDFFQKHYKNILKLHSNNFISRFWEIYNLIKLNNIDIIHTHHRYYDLISYFIKKINPKIKIVMTAHYHSIDKKYLSYKADHIICVSNKIKQTIISNYNIDEKKLSVLYNPVDTDLLNITKTKEELSKELGFDDDSLILSYIGRFDYDSKNIEIITDNLDAILKLSPKIKILFIGIGKDLNRLQNEITKYNEYVKIIINPVNISDFYNFVDVVIMPSKVESFGLVTIEAGLFKKTVIANNNSAISEYLKDNQNVLLFGNNIEFINRIKEIINNKNLSTKIGNSLYDYVLRNHQLESYLENLYKIYLNLLEK